MTRETPAPSPYLAARLAFSHERVVGPLRIHHDRWSGFAAEAHSHPEAQVLVPLAGRLHLAMEGRNHLIGPEWAALIPPGATHSSTHLDGDVEFLAAYLPGDWLERFAAAAQLPEGTATRQAVVWEPFLWLVARQLAGDVRNPAAAAEIALRAGLELMMAEVLARPDDKAAGARAGAAGGPASTADGRILRAIDRMVRDFAEPLAIEDLAAEAALSPRQFERLFREAIGTSPRKYLIGVRVSAAKQLLAQTAMRIGDIAHEAGFATAAHFAATFRQTTGVTPGEFRASGRR